MALRFGYITNGLSDHRISEALKMLADCGYSGVGLTLDHHHLDPFSPDVAVQCSKIADLLRELDMSIVIETGGRYVLDATRKHEPTMLSSSGRERRIDLLSRGVQIANDLGAQVVSFWSGKAESGVETAESWQRLVNGCAQVLDVAERHGVYLAFEPEPGMFVQYISEWEQLAKQLDNSLFAVTLDIGHCICIETQDVVECINRVAPYLRHVQIEDMKRGVHEHLYFGEGEVDFPRTLNALHRINYEGLVAVELSRHSHTAHTTVPSSIDFLRKAERESAYL